MALAWSNSPFRAGYESLWGTDLVFSIGPLEIDEDLRHWINDALMTLFFFVVGLEIKRELVGGELTSRRKAALPVIAAVGGMVMPALIYLGLNLGTEGASGWGIPMATDIAFAVGVLALLGDRVPSSLKVFILSLAIVDDIGAIVVIALFYAGGIDLGWLLGAGIGLIAVSGLRRAGVQWVPVYIAVGTVIWFATFRSGVHATIAGVALGFMTPARPKDEVVSVAERLQHLLHPWTSFAVIPLFALANAGVILTSEALRVASTSRVGLGVALGLVAGKVTGIAGASWLSLRLGVTELPAGVNTRHLVGAAAVAGIGFTVSLFITALAFEDAGLVDTAKLGVLMGSIVAGLLGASILGWRPRSAPAGDRS